MWSLPERHANGNSATNKSLSNILKKFNVTVPRAALRANGAGDASLLRAYGIMRRMISQDTYTDENGQFTTGYYGLPAATTGRFVRSPSEGPAIRWTALFIPSAQRRPITLLSWNAAPAVAVSEQAEGHHRHIKHSDNADTQIETPEEGGVFAVYLKAAGSLAKRQRIPATI